MHIHCSQDSLVSSSPSPLLATELSLSFPQSRQSWFAKSATAWRDAYLEAQTSEPSRGLSVIDCLADLSQLRRLPDLYDSNIAQLSVLHAIAAMVQDNRRCRAASAGIFEGAHSLLPSSSEGALAGDIQHSWLLRVFESLHQTFRLSETSAQTPAGILMVLELLLLHFHCSIEQMEVLAGREGFEEAQVTYPVLQRWAESREARYAVWQAGQILKLVRTLPPETMNDFHSVALYHAALCLWAYGTIASKRCAAQSEWAPTAGAQDVIIDGQESVETQRWVAFATCRRAFRLSGPSIHLASSSHRPPRACAI